MTRLDADPRVTEWSSEAFSIGYFDPSAGHKRRYFPDFKVKMNDKIVVFEIKPLKQTIPPELKKRKARKTLIKEAATYITNVAKWKSAQAYCAQRGWGFRLLTERELNIPT